MNTPRLPALVAALPCFLFAVAAASSEPPSASRPRAARSPTADAREQSAALERLFEQLGDDDCAVREAATRALFMHDESILPRLRARLAEEPDPEVRHRLRFVIENLVIPQSAVLVLRAAPGCGLQPGDVITHIGSQRLRSQAELRRRLAEPGGRLLLRVRDADGPRVVGPIDPTGLQALADFVLPRGPRVAQIVRLYADGYAERAYALLNAADGPIPENELPTPLRARIAYTSGSESVARKLLEGHAALVRATGEDWTSPSFFDLSGPGKAPFHLEWILAKRSQPQVFMTQNDPDLRVQRILMPANRFADAFVAAAGYWRLLFHGQTPQDASTVHIAGNELAVAAWMLCALDLRSECCRLIEPRSIILRRPQTAIHKWVRVETDAWLAFFAGDARGAVDGFYDDALAILQRPPRPDDRRLVIRNPQVAARIAFFLYQLPNDRRVAATLDAVNQPGHPALATYLDWMLRALDAHNQPAVRRDLQAALPNVPDDHAPAVALAVALLEYVQPRPDLGVLHAARVRAAAGDAESTTTRIDALRLLAERHAAEALALLAPHRRAAGLGVLWHTAAFLASPPEAAAGHNMLTDVLLAVPLGHDGHQWVVLTRTHRLLRFDAQAGTLAAIPAPSPSWFPGPRNAPWLGRDERSGRVWVYGRRRVFEIPRNRGGAAVRLNIRTEDIPAFDRLVGPHFAALAEALASAPAPAGERGEFLRSEVRSHAEFCADPDLPEIGVIRPLPRRPRFVHVALRSGPHLLIDTQRGRAWTSRWLAEAAELRRPPAFCAQAIDAAADGPPILILLSDQGVLRFEPDAGTLRRIALPGPEPYPNMIPESVPYERRDPRWVYCARLPEDGGGVYRIALADGGVEQMDMVNEALPPYFYAMLSRAEIRRRLDARLEAEDLPPLEAFVREASEAVRAWQKAAGVR